MIERWFSRRSYSRLRFFFFLFVFALGSYGVSARVIFDGLDLASDDRLLFRANSNGDGAPRQNVLFVADLSSLSLRQLTAFPERVDLLEGGRTLQIRNPFGAVRFPVTGGLPASVAGYPSFASGAAALDGRSEDMAASGDGKWILYVEPVSAAFGKLVLINVSNGSRILVADGVERPGQLFPACWSPDSRVFVYCRDGKLFFRTVNNTGDAVVDERYRLIGDGSISSVRWGAVGDFFFIRGSTVYRVRSSELFARALYADFLEIGSVAGKIPFDFDPNFDSFWIAPDSRSLLLSKEGRNLFYYPLGLDDYSEVIAPSLPYLMLPRACSKLNVIWSSADIVTVLASLPRDTERPVRSYRLMIEEGQPGLSFVELSDSPGPSAALSPDGTRALVWGPRGATLYDYVNWKPLIALTSKASYAALWLGNEEFILADSARIERRSVGGKRSLLCLSSSEEHAFEDGSSKMLAKVDGLWYSTDGVSPWIPSTKAIPRPGSAVSNRYRVYLEKQASGPYENLPMLRNIKGVGTTSLIVKNSLVYEPFPAAASANPVDSGKKDVPFSHGRRSGRREVALCFDLVDDAAGLPFVLDTLHSFGVEATFFLNGEFIRRHPSAAKEIVAAGHETASMFFAPIDLSDAKYRIDQEFITRGLARNEDDFFNAAGAELALLWHAPYYAVSSDIVAAAASVGYRTIGHDVDPLDWVTRIDARRSPGAYKSASELVNDVMAAKKPGSIVPIRLGVPTGGRDDYLFGRLDVLLDALVRAGYEVVPVSTLMEHAR